MPKKKISRETQIENAIAGGVIGAALGALFLGGKKSTVGAALLGAAIGAAATALDEARENEMSVLVEEDGVLYELLPNGKRKRIRSMNKKPLMVPSEFTLE